jgi:hypothetical protein
MCPLFLVSCMMLNVNVSFGYILNTPRIHSRLFPLRSAFKDGPEDDCPSRRRFLRSLLLVSSSTFIVSKSSEAYEQAYPVELGFVNGDSSRDLRAVRNERYQQKKEQYESRMDFVRDKNLFEFRGPKDVITCATWGGALWLISGSRSNPLVTPLANVLYKDKSQDWLVDRNNGLFAPFPIALQLVLLLVFFVLGIVTDRLTLFVSDGSANVSLQLAGVFLISGAALELGRVASGEKGPTRQEFERATQLQQEFEDFALKRLKVGGSCHRNDVVRAFRRFYAKYRQEDSTEYPLSNLEIERLLKEWNQAKGGLAEMTSAGFYNGLSINEQADVFVSR